MNQLSKCSSILFAFLCTLFFAEASPGWWSGEHNTHYHLITISSQKLSAAGLFDRDILRAASNCPDGPHKSPLDHDKIVRVKENFCATVGMTLLPGKAGPVNCVGDCQSPADCMGRTLHYLDDKADVTETDHKEELRNHVYNRYFAIRQHPLLNQSLPYYYGQVAAPDTDSLARQLLAQRSILISDMRRANMPPETRVSARDAVFARAFALVQVGQDRLIDLYRMEVSKNAAAICRDTPAYCKGLEKQIQQACQRKDVVTVKRLINEARHATAHTKQECTKLHEHENQYLQLCGGGGPITIHLQCPQGCDVMSGGAHKNFLLTVSGNVQFPLTFSTRFIKAPQCGISWRQGDQTLTQHMMTQRGDSWQYTFPGAIYCNVGSNRPECRSFTYSYEYWAVTADKRKSNIARANFTCTTKQSPTTHSPCPPTQEPRVFCQASDNRNIDCCSRPPACTPNPKCIKVTCSAVQRCVPKVRR